MIYEYGKDTFAPGLWLMPENVYHADHPCPAPSLSSGILCTLLEQSPLHAWHAHPRLGKGGGQDSTRATEFGSAVHKLALDRGAQIEIIDAKDYRTKAAQEARGEAEAAGRIPLLATVQPDAERLGAALRAAAERHLGCPMADAYRELVVIWEEGGFWRRAMIDAVDKSLRRPLDLKTTQGTAAPDPSAKRIYDAGYHIKAAHYLRGLDAVDPDGAGRRRFAFIFGEADAPYAVGPALEVDAVGSTLAESQRKIGTALWDSCLRADRWPGYTDEPLQATPPPWALAAWEMRMQNDASLNPIYAGDANE